MGEERTGVEPQQEVAPPAPEVVAPVAPTTTFGGAGASVAGALRSGTMSPAGVLSLQRAAGNQAVAAVLARQPPAAAPPTADPAAAPGPTANRSPAFTVEVPEAVTDLLKAEGKASYFKGSLNVKGEVQF